MGQEKSKQSFTYDLTLLIPVLILIGVSVIMVLSTSLDTHLLARQGIFSALGFVILLGCSRIPYSRWKVLSAWFLILAILLLAILFIPGVANEINGARRWYQFGTISFQPAELAKFAMVLYLAYSLSKKEDRVQELSIGFIPHIIVLGILAALIIKQPDFGSVVILSGITWIMMYAGGVRPLHLLVSLALLSPFIYYMILKRLNRIKAVWDPWKYYKTEGYQTAHSLMAFGLGGITGVGLGEGHQKLGYLPFLHTDFIISAIGEELGLLGVYFVLAMYVMILWRGITIAQTAKDKFGSFLALGLTISIGIHVCINMGVALGICPTKGLTLPFLSYGGTSLIINMACIGVLMNISASNPKR